MVDDYVITLVLFDDQNDAHPITAFKKNLAAFHGDGVSIREKLATILNKDVNAIISKSKPDDNPILSKLEFQ